MVRWLIEGGIMAILCLTTRVKILKCFSVNFKLDLKTEADLEIRSSDEIQTKMYYQSGNLEMFHFLKLFKSRMFLNLQWTKTQQRFVCEVQ